VIPQTGIDPVYYRPTRFITRGARREARRAWIKAHGWFWVFVVWLCVFAAYLIREAAG